MRKASDIIVGAAGGTATALTTQTALMIANVSYNISHIESSLRDVADLLRANFKLTFSDYCILALGVICLRCDLPLPRLIGRDVAA